jgi:hemerythrin-like domain-containing protein
MMPVGPLMIEHRLIERMIEVMRKELINTEKGDNLNPHLIGLAVEFIQTYADKCHHGKEENILFRDLKKKNLQREHRRIMEELIEEHRWGRETTKKLVEANLRYVNGEKEAARDIVNFTRELVIFYPKHIEKEDRHFFIPCMKYFTDEEKEHMLTEEWEFDKNFIHEKYKDVVTEAEKSLEP